MYRHLISTRGLDFSLNKEDQMFSTLCGVCLCVALFSQQSLAGSRDVWPASAYLKAKQTLSQLSTEEKVILVSGMNGLYQSKNCTTDSRNCSYVGYIPAIPRLNLPDITLEDGPQGVADGMRNVTQFPSVMTVSQAWDPDLMRAFGQAMGAEQVAKGSSIHLGPAVALVRVPYSGRNFEYISEDPYLNHALTGPMVAGIQSNNISACVKHWIFNSQETNRSGMSVHVAERVGRELYAPPYAAAVDAGVGSVMCSFNRINGTWSCANAASLIQWLKTDLGFDGFVVSDWGATHGTIDFAMGGLDQEQEWVKNSIYFGPALLECVNNGSVPMARLDDMVYRGLVSMYAVGYGVAPPTTHNKSAVANSTQHAQLALTLARASITLLKNENNLLPLSPASLPRGIAVIGLDTITGGGGSGQVVAPYQVSTRDGLLRALPGVNVTYYNGDNITAAANLAAAVDVVVFIASAWGSEGMDRANLSLGCAPWAGSRSCTWWPDQDEELFAVAKANPKTVVVLRTPGAVLMPWLEHVGAVLFQLFAGQEAGTVVGEVVAGLLNPKGKLTITFPASETDTWLSPRGGGPVLRTSYPGTERGNDTFCTVDYAEGLFVGYRWYDSEGTRPLFPFGHGLSFTQFAYSNLTVSDAVSTTSNATISLTVAHAGGPAGEEVVQLYVEGLPGDPIRALKGFTHVHCAVGKTDTALFTLTARDLTWWSTTSHTYELFPTGQYRIWVGGSSHDLRLQGQVQVRRDA